MFAWLSKWYAQPTNQIGVATLAGAASGYLSKTLPAGAAISMAVGAVMLLIKNDNSASTAANAAVAAGVVSATEGVKPAGIGSVNEGNLTH